jgi:Glycosyltransferase family 87
VAERTASHGNRTPSARVIAAAALAAVLATGALAHHLLSLKDRYTRVDFRIFYAWWVEYSSGQDPWIPILAQTEVRPGLKRPHFCNYTPVFVEVFSPFARLGQRTAWRIWEAAQLVFALLALAMLVRGPDPPVSLPVGLLALALTMVSRPMLGTLTYSQVTPLLLALAVGAWYADRRGHGALAGLLLAFAALVKLFPAAVGGYFLFRRRWRMLCWTAAFFAAGVLISGPSRWIAFAHSGLPFSMHHEVARAELTVLAFTRRSVVDALGTARGATVLGLTYAITALLDLALVGVAAAITVRSGGRGESDGLALGLWLALALLMSPLAWIHETILLVPLYLFGLLGVWRVIERRRRPLNWAFVVGAIMLVLCVLTDLIKALPHPGFVALLAAYVSAALIFSEWTRPAAG